MSLGKRIAELRKERGMEQAQLAKKLNIATSTLGMWETDKRKPNTEAIVSIAQFFQVSTDYLLGNSEKKHYYDLTEKDKKDVGLEVEEVLNGMTGGINFYGEPMTDEGREKLKASLEMALELSKREAKKKFTPKKYRDG